MNLHPTAVRRALVEDILPFVVIATLAAAVLYLVSGCTAATFDTQETDDGSANDAGGPAVDPLRARGGDRRAALAALDGAVLADAPDAAEVVEPGDAVSQPDVRADAREASPDVSGEGSVGGCTRYCLVAGATGLNLPLGSPACTFDGQCCSGSCFVDHPGTGERGVCTAPSGDPTTPHWCGAPTEWCADAVAAGIARCVP